MADTLSPVQQAVCDKLQADGAVSLETAAWPGEAIPIQNAVRKLLRTNVLNGDKAGRVWLVDQETQGQ